MIFSSSYLSHSILRRDIKSIFFAKFKCFEVVGRFGCCSKLPFLCCAVTSALRTPSLVADFIVHVSASTIAPGCPADIHRGRTDKRLLGICWRAWDGWNGDESMHSRGKIRQASQNKVWRFVPHSIRMQSWWKLEDTVTLKVTLGKGGGMSTYLCTPVQLFLQTLCRTHFCSHTLCRWCSPPCCLGSSDTRLSQQLFYKIQVGTLNRRQGN